MFKEAEHANFLTEKLIEAIERNGFCIIAGVFDEKTIAKLKESLEAVGEGASVSRRKGVYAIRNLFDVVAAVRDLADSPQIRALVEPVLGAGCFPVRAILFDKTREAPWKVAWHQDLSIAVRERKDMRGFVAWSEKSGVIHVQPPAEILEQMLTLRLHLDECGETNGPLKVMPGSHLAGRLNQKAIERWRRVSSGVTCVVPRGGALLMRPLLVHSSPTPQSPHHRRVVHLEFAAELLPGGLAWREGVQGRARKPGI